MFDSFYEEWELNTCARLCGSLKNSMGNFDFFSMFVSYYYFSEGNASWIDSQSSKCIRDKPDK